MLVSGTSGDPASAAASNPASVPPVPAAASDPASAPPSLPASTAASWPASTPPSLPTTPQDGNLNEPIRVCQLKVPFAGMYSFVYQNVQSSVGSMTRLL